MININIYATLPSTLPSVRQCSVSIADFNRIEQSELRIYYYRLKKIIITYSKIVYLK